MLEGLQKWLAKVLLKKSEGFTYKIKNAKQTPTGIADDVPKGVL